MAANSYRRDCERVARWLREWSDRDLATVTDTKVKEKSLGYIAARTIEELLGRLNGPSSRLVELLNDVRYRLGAKHLPIEQRLINEAIDLLDATKDGKP